MIPDIPDPIHSPMISFTYFLSPFLSNGCNALIGYSQECQSQSQLSTKRVEFFYMPPPLNLFLSKFFCPGKGILKSTPPITSSSFYLGRMKSVSASPWLSSNILQSLSFKVLMGTHNPVNREKITTEERWVEEYGAEIWKKMGTQWGRHVPQGDCRWQKCTRRLGPWSHPLNFLFISIRNSPCFKLNRLLIFFVLIEDWEFKGFSLLPLFLWVQAGIIPLKKCVVFLYIKLKSIHLHKNHSHFFFFLRQPFF